MNDFLLFSIFILLSYSIQGQSESLSSIHSFDDFVQRSSKSEWTKPKYRDSIAIDYRGLTLNEDISTRQIRVSCKLANTSLEAILSAIQDQKKVVCWNETICEAQLLSDSSGTWVTHHLFDIPYPFPKLDLVSEYNMYTKEGVHYVNSISVPTYIPEVPDVRRELYSYSQWEIKPSGQGQFDVAFSVITLASSAIPKFLKDPIVQNTMFNSFENLSQMVSSKSAGRKENGECEFD
ncbi:MAG: hypothetical protein AAF193_04745 [Bacteroidota bacterium]